MKKIIRNFSEKIQELEKQLSEAMAKSQSVTRGVSLKSSVSGSRNPQPSTPRRSVTEKEIRKTPRRALHNPKQTNSGLKNTPTRSKQANSGLKNTPTRSKQTIPRPKPETKRTPSRRSETPKRESSCKTSHKKQCMPPSPKIPFKK